MPTSPQKARGTQQQQTLLYILYPLSLDFGDSNLTALFSSA